ncbi:hypothetical protein [Pelagicoccus sp. SDUM812005]|uniref:hypothetical protein n=1 Tax=Pelagicoccus sp. SDUM812005 TaxID=3041257 RepID=UPI00280C7DE4|nr:hypothetical protein [Pelagicoccus sp. SDUM812005]MDQ8180620.1 hypothetical protein [Pelagicoccus sp. SDUM812005]
MKTPLLFCLSLLSPAVSFSQGYLEKDGLISIEAEDFASQTQADLRRWFRFDASTPPHSYADADDVHVEGASGGAYIEILPDTRTNHDEPLIKGVNFSPEPGQMCVLTYPIWVDQPGRYYIWGRAFSTGPEDNGAHFGLDGAWPESSRRLQFCQGKEQWTWSSAQRRPENHCGTPLTLWVDIAEAGQHTLMLSMREDGIELDKIVLSRDESFRPEGVGPEATRYEPAPLPERTRFVDIKNYRYLWHATEDFEIDSSAAVPYYLHQQKGALAIDATKLEYRNKFARASKVFSRKKAQTVDLALVTLAETDGESEYRVLINDKLIGSFKNPETSEDYKEVTFTIPQVTLNPGDVVSVESNAVTNGKIPEGDGTAFARGRWIGLALQ